MCIYTGEIQNRRVASVKLKWNCLEVLYSFFFTLCYLFFYFFWSVISVFVCVYNAPHTTICVCCIVWYTFDVLYACCAITIYSSLTFPVCVQFDCPPNVCEPALVNCYIGPHTRRTYRYVLLFVVCQRLARL